MLTDDSASREANRVARFYNQRATAEQWVIEDKNASVWRAVMAIDGRALMP